jgi:hypothetical protein
MSKESRNKDLEVSAYTPIRTKANNNVTMGKESDLLKGVMLRGAQHKPQYTKHRKGKGQFARKNG